jgi:putative ABC transport system permease protein
MNLAWKDIRHQWPRFSLTALGLGLLFSIVLAMGGIYRGLVEDATLLVDLAGADLWLVQPDTRGPFAERSAVPKSLADRARVVPGVAWARAFATTTVQREHEGRPLRATLVGLGWPEARGDDLPIARGRALEAAHGELIADASLALSLGERLRLGDDDYEVVGVGRGLIASSGDGLMFLTESDVMRIQHHLPPESVRLERAAGRDVRAAGSGPNAVLVKASSSDDLAAIRATISAWPDVSIYSADEQRTVLLEGVVDKARKQIGLFRALLVIVSAIVVALILYQMTMSKAREIALIKLMGARLSVVASLVLSQALSLGALGYGVALAISSVAFVHFPRRVVLNMEEYVGVAAVALGVCLVASLAGLAKALRIPATSVLSS